MAGMAAAAVVAAGMAVVVVMVAAADTGIVFQLSNQQSFHCLVGITADTAEQLDARISQSHLGSTANAAADQHIDLPGLQKACQRAVAEAGSIHNFRRDHLILLNFVDLKMRGMSEVLKDQTSLISYRDFQTNISFRSNRTTVYHI